ncbi:MAG: hypothetical protein RID07_18405, partial [Lacipirellulaceae bacterium]
INVGPMIANGVEVAITIDVYPIITTDIDVRSSANIRTFTEIGPITKIRAIPEIRSITPARSVADSRSVAGSGTIARPRPADIPWERRRSVYSTGQIKEISQITRRWPA